MFKDILNNLLKENRCNALKLAKEIDVPKTIVYAWKNGERTPSMENLVKLSNFFNVSLEMLCGLPEHTLQDDETELAVMLRAAKEVSPAAYENIMKMFLGKLDFFLKASGKKDLETEI